MIIKLKIKILKIRMRDAQKLVFLSKIERELERLLSIALHAQSEA